MRILSGKATDSSFFYSHLIIGHHLFNPIALRTAKTPSSFGHSECNKVTGFIPSGMYSLFKSRSLPGRVLLP